MKIKFIYTYQNKPQEIIDYPFVLSILSSKETLVEFALSDLNNEEKQQLVKISSCIICENEIQEPEWFVKCNGKLYFKDGISV